MTSALQEPTFSIQLTLWSEGTVTLVCDVCHGHTVMSEQQMYLLAPDYIGCAECGVVNALPTR